MSYSSALFFEVQEIALAKPEGKVRILVWYISSASFDN